MILPQLSERKFSSNLIIAHLHASNFSVLKTHKAIYF